VVLLGMTILILEPEDYSAQALAVYRSLGRVYFYPDLAVKDKKTILAQVDILVVGLKHQIDKKFLDQITNLKIIASPTTGMNHLDLAEIKARGIKVISLRGRKGFLRNVPSTAEETFALILALVRNLPWAFDAVKKGEWDRIKWRGHQLKGKTIGLLGFGRLGRIVARYAKAFDMKVLACDPNVSEKFIKSRGAIKVGVEELFKKSDIVSLHVLLTDETHDLVKSGHLKSMKPSAYFINTARAELVEKGALEKALKQKWIAGAAVDVLRSEQGDGSHLKNNPLLRYALTHNNLLIVPHLGGATYEAMQTTQDFVAELVRCEVKKMRA
ncbi:MAG: NAD(P)-dependent oxidoreductase, partial [Patescibacteria group bacterium]